MLLNFTLLIISLAVIIKSADLAIRYSSRLAEGLKLSRYLIGFLIVAVISILPETFVAITSAVEGIPAFGLGTLFGSNVADLTLVFVLVVLISGHNLKVESRVIKNRFFHIGAMMVPIVLGLDGHYSRAEGVVLITVGLCFYYFIFKKNKREGKAGKKEIKVSDVFKLLLSMAGLLLGAHFTVRYGVDLARGLSVSPVLIGMFVVGLGTTLPELLFSIKAARRAYDGLALGDILGTVVADATVVVGLVAMISPFAFNQRIIYISGVCMVFATVLLFHFMKTGKTLTKKEALLLLFFYFVFVTAELLIN
ncbi:sodium:calcium antiporter [Candidatus Kuenenbacteria bacterium]|nr:sodium:calcium antiporter [Candidatus Kuenenbacteria bacterium]